MTIAFTKVKLPWGWLSNMSAHPIVDEAGVEWRTAEHWFQASRFADPELREAIRSHKSPMVAKFFAKKHLVSMVVVPQSEQDLANMLKVLRWKVAQHPPLKAELLSSGEELIVEDVTKRPHGSGKFWGAALIRTVTTATEVNGGQLWEGENVLGQMWMKIRSECREVL